MPDQTLGSRKAVFILTLAAALMIPAAMFLPHGGNYIAVMVLMIVFMATIGATITGRLTGILINDRKVMSLSRFQMVLWTLIILSAYLTMAMERIRAGEAQALDIAMDWHLWALMGISTTSLVGTPLIQTTKMAKDPKTDEVNKTADAVGAQPSDVKANSKGILFGNATMDAAAFTDMFEGDEVGNAANVDLAKVQMFLFTMVAALSYAVLLFNSIAKTAPAELTKFPTLSEGLIAILGISHAGYLMNKSTDHTKTT